jgi:tRNA (guanine37-N1)-methyltransferase
MRIDVLTIFPGYLAPLDEALVGRARRAGRIDLRVHDLRRWASGVHKAVDDSPYGGGPGMVMVAPVWGAALDEVTGSGEGESDDAVPRLLVPTPAGPPLTQERAAGWATEPWLVLACGRYEGIDARVTADAARRMPVEEFSLGDYVLAGGEVAALVAVEAVSRLLPGVLGNPASAELDSFSDGLLEAPSYTRPESWRDLDVPDVLRGGDHGAVARWRRDRSLERTAAVRPDLLDALLDAHGEAAFDARDTDVLRAAGYDPVGRARRAVWQTGEVAAGGDRPDEP